MRPPPEIWRQRLWVWLPAALFFLVNASAFAVYRFGYADRVEALKDELKSQHAAEKSEEAKRRHHEGLLQQATINRQRIEQLYAESFSTRRRRLTGVTAEVISLAGKAGLAPRALAYPEQEIQGYNLIKRSFIFTVDGRAWGSFTGSYAIPSVPMTLDLQQRPGCSLGPVCTSVPQTMLVDWVAEYTRS